MSNLFPSGRMRHLDESGLNPIFDGDSLGDNEDFNVDILETDEAFIVEADLPGLGKENIELDYFNNVLSIRTHHAEEHEEIKDEDNYIRRERSSCSYHRQFLVGNVAEEKIRATFKKGVLIINLPKNDIDEDEKTNINIEPF